jgi:hypothetical protein
MIAAELYKKTLEGYLLLPATSPVSLKEYCKEYRINYRGLRSWMKTFSISTPKVKRSSACAETSSSFVPLSILPPQSMDKLTSVVSVSGLLKDVNISLTNGVNVTIREINNQDMIELIHSFNPL